MSQHAVSASAQVPCPQCQHLLPSYDTDHSAYCGCPRCGAFFEQHPFRKPAVLRTFQERPPQELPLPLGSAGTLLGTAYQVVGYMLRKEAQTAARWEEYMLWQPGTTVHHQLAVYEGHWVLLAPTTEQIKVGKPLRNCQRAYSKQGIFALYNRYSPQILCAQGEFDWNILEDEQLTVWEFIDPPLMLVREMDGGQQGHVHWYLGRHVEPQQIAEAFGLPPNQIPRPYSTGAVQPPPGESQWPAVKKVALWAALLLMATHLFLMAWGNETVLDQEFTSPVHQELTTGTSSIVEQPVLVSPSFTVPGTGALSIDLWADINNDWIDLPFTVVNEQTGQYYEITRGMEYYSGVEGGESWSEGSKDTDALLNSVPAGRYHLNFYPSTNDANTNPIPFRVKVLARASCGSNTVLALVLLSLYPIIIYLRRSSHERERWQNSDYSPVPEPESTS